jgi:osmotically-inducible protein OsmY
MVTDVELQRSVQTALLREPSINAAEIGVTAKNGIVTLTGTVSSNSERWEAEDAAKEVYGVSAVANEIQVRLPDEYTRTDTDIAEAAVNALLWDVAVPDQWIQVTVSDGWVTLSGQVDLPHQRNAAERAVRYLTGVRGVSNEIMVQPAVTAEDVKTRIEAVRHHNAEVNARSIHAEVDQEEGHGK